MVIPLEPIYDWLVPGEPLEVLTGNGWLGESAVQSVRLWAPMKRDVGIRWRLEDAGDCDLGNATLRVLHPGLGDVDIAIDVDHSAGRGRVAATELGSGSRMTRVVTHWINVPLILPSGVLRAGGRTWAGRWTATANGWVLTLDGRPDLSETIRYASETDEQFAMTHVGELRRVDGGEFDSETAWHVLHGWQIALSFALGRWVAPALPVGYDASGKQVWEQWAFWRCDEMRGYDAWWDTHTGDDLAAFVSAYLESYLAPAQSPIVRLLAHHVIAANHSGTTGEAKIMLAQAGLEYLAWVDLVLSGRVSRRKYRGMPADEALRRLLEGASIPTAVPKDLHDVAELAAREGSDGPKAVAWVRNRLVHPKDPEEPYRIEGLVWQTAQLLMEYAELLLLHRVGYEGQFKRRYPPHRWAHDNEPVPWAADQSARSR